MEKSDNDLGAIEGTPPSPSPSPLSEGTGGEESWGSTDSRTPNPRPTKIIRMDSSNPPPPPPPPEMAVEEAPTPTPIAEDESTEKPAEMGSASINAGDERPIGRKAAKAAKRTTSDVSGPSIMSQQRFEEYQDSKVALHEEKVKMHKENLELKKIHASIAKQRMEFELKKYEREEDFKVLNTDTSRMEPSVAHWYQCRKMEIMAKYNQGGGF